MSRRTYLRLLSIFVIAAAFILAAAAFTQECASAKVKKSVVKKAKSYAGAKAKLFKVGGKWYCFRKKKVKTGLQKVGKEFYFFSKSNGTMLMKGGLRKAGPRYYYIIRKKGKAPCLRSSSRKIKGEVWFFMANGRRYSYSYLDTGSQAGNDAAGMIISEAKIRSDKTGKEEDLKAAYSKIVRRSSYRITEEPDLSHGKTGWIGDFAKDCAAHKGGKCYGFAALTYVTFKALGEADASLVTGTCNTRPGEKDPSSGNYYMPSAHAWVLVPDKASACTYMYDSVFDITRNKKSLLLLRKPAFWQDGGSAMKVEGFSYLYYPEYITE